MRLCDKGSPRRILFGLLSSGKGIFGKLGLGKWSDKDKKHIKRTKIYHNNFSNFQCAN
jgi:hypothetical protein